MTMTTRIEVTFEAAGRRMPRHRRADRLPDAVEIRDFFREVWGGAFDRIEAYLLRR